jgi:hypothetical protein
MSHSKSRQIPIITSLVGQIALSAFVASISVMGSESFGQCDPRPELWTVVSIPPGQTTGIPAVCYDPVDGVLSLNTQGQNGVIDTASNSLIDGDDVGMISILVTGPQNWSVYPEFGDNFDLTSGVFWFSNHISSRFNIVGTPIIGQFLFPPGQFDIGQFAPGLDPSDFSLVEIAINFSQNAPGGIIAGRVQFVPEPSRLAVLLSILGLLRRRQSAS